MANNIVDPADTTWVLKITRERLNEFGHPVWSDPSFRGPYHSLKAAQLQATKQRPHPVHVERARKLGNFVGRVHVDILELKTSYSVVYTVDLHP